MRQVSASEKEDHRSELVACGIQGHLIEFSDIYKVSNTFMKTEVRFTCEYGNTTSKCLVGYYPNIHLIKLLQEVLSLWLVLVAIVAPVN